MAFKEGDLVMLKSGSPPMTVNSISNNGMLNCVYFDYTKNQPVNVTVSQAAVVPGDDSGPSIA